jgi:hypothetical protein
MYNTTAKLLCKNGLGMWFRFINFESIGLFICFNVQGFQSKVKLWELNVLFMMMFPLSLNNTSYLMTLTW